jgi:hypothetical protein
VKARLVSSRRATSDARAHQTSGKDSLAETTRATASQFEVSSTWKLRETRQPTEEEHVQVGVVDASQTALLRARYQSRAVGDLELDELAEMLGDAKVGVVDEEIDMEGLVTGIRSLNS